MKLFQLPYAALIQALFKKISGSDESFGSGYATLGKSLFLSWLFSILHLMRMRHTQLVHINGTATG
jgi:hypothetical protein